MSKITSSAKQDLPIVGFDEESWNRYLLLGLLSALIPLNALLNPEFR